MSLSPGLRHPGGALGSSPPKLLGPVTSLYLEKQSLRRTTTIAFALGAAFLTARLAAAHDYTAGTLSVRQPWARATPPGARVGGAYMVIENRGTEPDRLVGGSSAVAGRIEIHEMETTDNVMRMRPLTAGLEVGPGAKVEIRPGSYHVMLVDLKNPLRQAERVSLTLEFAKAGKIEVELVVGGIGARVAPDPEPHGTMHGSEAR